MEKKVWLLILLSALLLALAYPYMVFAKTGRETIQSAIAASKAAHGYEVEIDRFKSRLDQKATMDALRLLPKAAIRSQGQVQQALRLKMRRDTQGRLRYQRLQHTQPTQPAAGVKLEPLQTAPQEAIFSIDATGARYDVFFAPQGKRGTSADIVIR